MLKKARQLFYLHTNIAQQAILCFMQEVNKKIKAYILHTHQDPIFWDGGKATYEMPSLPATPGLQPVFTLPPPSNLFWQ